ncbi:hypothetical protein ACP70R_015695 [Stipagrostis hirtigluma subsp. patula]
MHLGGPDNITALSLEDDKLSNREVFKTLFELLGTPPAVYKQYAASGVDGALLWASFVMVAVGVAKYVERSSSIFKADFGNIRTSSKKQPELRIQPLPSWQKNLKDEQALLIAHELLHITKGAFADYSVKERPFQQDPNLKEIFSNKYEDVHGWNNIWKVVEMELPLMYDILYTKVAVTHTRVG